MSLWFYDLEQTPILGLSKILGRKQSSVISKNVTAVIWRLFLQGPLSRIHLVTNLLLAPNPRLCEANPLGNPKPGLGEWPHLAQRVGIEVNHHPLQPADYSSLSTFWMQCVVRVLDLESIGLPALLLLLVSKLNQESPTKASLLVTVLFPIFFFPTYLQWLAEHFKTSLTNESKTALGRRCFGPSNVCIFISLSLDFFKRKQFIVLQPQPACFPSFNQTHLFFHLWFSATVA